MSTMNLSRIHIYFLFIGFFMFGFTSSSHAQIDKVTNKILKRVENRGKRKAEQKVEEKVDETTDKAVEKTFDKLFKKIDKAFEGDSTEKKKDETAGEKESKPEVSFTPSEPDPNVTPSDWIGSLTMKMEERKNGKMEKGYPQNTTFHIDKYKVAFAMAVPDQEEETISIIDRQYRKITTKIIDEDGNKTAVTIPMMSGKIKVEDTDGEINDARDNFRKTGRTKVIAGYRCEEYAYENDEVESSVWLSESMGADFRKFFSWISIEDKQKGDYSDYEEFYPLSGAAMESTSIDKKSGVETHMTITNVDKGPVDEAIFSLEGYNHQDMSEIMNTPEGKKVGDFFKKLSEKVEEDDKN